MYTLVVVLHVLVCIILIGVVLLQAGKGAEMGAAFGGSSQSLFGSRGAATFLSKLTVGAAIVFMVTSLSLSLLKKGRSVTEDFTETKASPAPAAAPPASVAPSPTPPVQPPPKAAP